MMMIRKSITGWIFTLVTIAYWDFYVTRIKSEKQVVEAKKGVELKETEKGWIDEPLIGIFLNFINLSLGNSAIDNRISDALTNEDMVSGTSKDK
eukprot:2079909-Ditylum_brightwellii.AAC.1